MLQEATHEIKATVGPHRVEVRDNEVQLWRHVEHPGGGARRSCILVMNGDADKTPGTVKEATRVAACLSACEGIEDPSDLRRQRDAAHDALARIAEILNRAYEASLFEGFQQTPISQQLRNGDLPEIHELAKPYTRAEGGAS